MMISYAQNFEDVTLWRALQDVHDGRYVDVGALHPEIDSVTKWFYDQGWSGINIEPVPEMFAVIEAARTRDKNIRAAAGAAAGVADMAVVSESMGLSSLDVSAVESNVAMHYTLLQVEVVRLRDILEPWAGQDIHFLKIDAEGTEHEVLLGMDFNRFRPWVLVVEATAPLSQTKTSEKCTDILREANYQHAYFDGLNEFYVAGEKIELARKLAVPPNVFDKFELAETVRERQAREQLEHTCNSLSGENQKLHGDISTRDSELVTARNELANVHSEIARVHSELAGTHAALAVSNDEKVRLCQELTAAQEEIARLTPLLAASNDALAAERETVGELQRKLTVAENEITALREQLRSSELAVGRLTEDLSELATALKKRRDTELASRAQLQQILNSRSFRWLAPARRLRALLLPHRQ